MRPRLDSAWRSGKWLEALALIAGAVVMVVVVVALRGSVRSRGHVPLREPSSPRASVVAIAASRNGAAEAATTYLGLLAETASGRADVHAKVRAMTTGPLGSELEQGLPVLARALRARLAATADPVAFDGWPLGYRVTSFSPGRATVSIWHLDLAASSTLGLMTTDYATTTYDVRWVAGAWRIDQARTVAGPTPPRPNASSPVVDRFTKAVRAFAGYRYAP